MDSDDIRHAFAFLEAVSILGNKDQYAAMAKHVAAKMAAKQIEDFLNDCKDIAETDSA